MAVNGLLTSVALLALASSLASAYDPSPLQDFCVAVNDTKLGVFVNGKFCKDANHVVADDFAFSGLNIAGNTTNQVRSYANLVTVDRFAGLNTLGLSIARIDYEPYGGLNAPHSHPRASEILTVVEGTLYAGFVTSDPNKLFTKVLYPGDVFVFPSGLIHFQLNVGKTKALAIAAFTSQNPGRVSIANAVFGAQPPINPDVLTKAFRLDKNIVENLQKQFLAHE